MERDGIVTPLYSGCRCDLTANSYLSQGKSRKAPEAANKALSHTARWRTSFNGRRLCGNEGSRRRLESLGAVERAGPGTPVAGLALVYQFLEPYRPFEYLRKSEDLHG
jgi:hypothetical protein